MLLPVILSLAAFAEDPPPTGTSVPLDLEATPGTGRSAPSGPTTSTATCLRSLDFLVHDGKARVVVGLGEGSAAWRMEDPHTFVVLVPTGRTPVSLQRPLDTSSFATPVLSVEAHDRTPQPAGTGDPGCEVVVRLREGIQPAIYRQGDHLVVDFPIGPQYASVASPAPASSRALTGAYTHEVLIDSRGRTWDPAALLSPSQATPAFTSSSFDAPVTAWDRVDRATSSGTPLISLDLVNADIHNVLRLFSTVGHVNIVASDDVQGNVTVRMENVPWDQALAAVLASMGLGAETFGDRILCVKPGG